jgi:ABC-type glycerol-3-phosphate transport system substrate-binding protein
MKKTFGLTLAILAALSVSLFANGSQQSGPAAPAKSEAAPAAPAKAKPVTLTVWDFKYSEQVTGAAFKKMDEMFEAANPGVTINHVAQPESNYYQLLASAFTAGTPVDVVMTHSDNRDWNLKDYFEILDPYIKDTISDYSAGALKVCSESRDPTKDIAILPQTAQGEGIYYNKTLFKQAGLDPEKAPAKWDDFLAACAALKKAGITPIELGNKGQTFGIDFMYRVILGTLLGDKLNGFADGTLNFTCPEFKEATAMLKQLYDNGYVNTDNASITYFSDAIDAFKAGKAAFFPGLDSDIAHWKDFGDALGIANVGYFPAPVASDAKYPDAQVTQGAGIGWAMVKYGKNKDIAAKYMKFYTSGAGAKVFMDASGALVPNSTVPVDASNTLLATVLKCMSGTTAPDLMNIVPGGMVNDFYNWQTSFFISKEISQDDSIAKVQDLYKNNLQ